MSFFFPFPFFLSYHKHVSVSISRLCDTTSHTKQHFCRHTPHFLKHLLSLQLFLPCVVLPVKHAALFHQLCPQCHNSSLCFEILFRICVNPSFLLGSLRASLALLTCCKYCFVFLRNLLANLCHMLKLNSFCLFCFFMDLNIVQV